MCCGTCAQINSDLAPVNDKGEGGIVPGCGCSSQLVREIVHELNLRKDGRGKVAQMRQQKFMLEKISKMAIQFPVLLTRLGVQYPPDEATLRRIFDHTPLMRPLAEVAYVAQNPEFPAHQYDAWTEVKVIKERCREGLLWPSVLISLWSVRDSQILDLIPWFIGQCEVWAHDGAKRKNTLPARTAQPPSNSTIGSRSVRVAQMPHPYLESPWLKFSSSHWRSLVFYD